MTNHLKTARRFIRWLHRTDAFAWIKPIDAEDALRVRVAGLRTPKEIAALRDGVSVWSKAELATLYHYATDRERLLILLGLNCGFAQAEICTLRCDDIVGSTESTIIKRIRQKNQVYGEFVLWPETVRAINWFSKWSRGAPQADTVGDCSNDYLMVTLHGRCNHRQQLSNAWNRLLDRVRVDHPTFRRLSFKYLRKTAGQLIRESSDGEISAVFLCHGQAVASDNLADVYTNRPFSKVASALAQVRHDLKSIFDGATHAFENKPASSPNISLKKIQTIRKMHAEGRRQVEIVRATGLTSNTVRRWSGREQAQPSMKLTVAEYESALSL